LVVKPNLVLGISAPAFAKRGADVPVSANARFNSGGAEHGSIANIPTLPLHWSADNSAATSPTDSQLVNGSANTTLHFPADANTVTASATLDNQTVGALIRTKLINTRQAAIVSAPHGWSVFAEPGAWRGQHPITYLNTWLVCNGKGANCRKTKNHSSSLRHNRKLRGKSVRLQTVASNATESVTSTSKRVLIDSLGHGPSGGPCFGPGASTQFTIGFNSDPIDKASVVSGKEKIKPIKKTSKGWTYKIQLASTHLHRTVVRAFYSNTAHQRDHFKTRAFLTCKGK